MGGFGVNKYVKIKPTHLRQCKVSLKKSCNKYKDSDGIRDPPP